MSVGVGHAGRDTVPEADRVCVGQAALIDRRDRDTAS